MGGRGNSGSARRQVNTEGVNRATTFQSIPEGHEITISRRLGDMTLTSYGEG